MTRGAARPASPRALALGRCAGALALALAGGAPFACQQGAGAIETRAAATPSLDIERLEHDFGARREGERLVHRFALRNAGSAPLVVERVERGYSCRASPPPAVIPPGSDAVIEVTCSTAARGDRLRERLRLHSNDPARPEVTLELRAVLEPALAFDATLVELEPEPGATATQAVRLRGYRAREASPSVVELDLPDVEATVLSAGGGAPPGLTIACRGRHVGRRVGRVRVATGLAEPAELSLGLGCRVAGNLTVTPDTPYFNLREPPPHERWLTVTSRRPDFALTGAAVLEGPFVAEVEPGPARGARRVRLRVDDAALPPGERAVRGRLRLGSNDPLEPHKEVPLFAMGAAQSAPPP